MERPDFAPVSGAAFRDTPTERPSRNRASISCSTPPSDSLLPRSWKMVSPRQAIQPTSGQRLISRLATKPIIRWLCSAEMSIQLTWLATNTTAPGSGVPWRRGWKPTMRIRPDCHSRITRYSSGSPPMRTLRVSGVINSNVSGRSTARCHSSNGTR